MSRLTENHFRVLLKMSFRSLMKGRVRGDKAHGCLESSSSKDITQWYSLMTGQRR